MSDVNYSNTMDMGGLHGADLQLEWIKMDGLTK